MEVTATRYTNFPKTPRSLFTDAFRESNPSETFILRPPAISVGLRGTGIHDFLSCPRFSLLERKPRIARVQESTPHISSDRTRTKKVASSFRLRWTGEDILTNISLQAKLSEQGIELPDFEMPDDKSGIDNYFKSVADSISKEQEWNVLADIYLDFFSFTKFIMYKDLDPLAWPEGMSPADHPLMRAIFDPSEDGPSQSGFDESEIDQKLDFRNLYHVMDSDPSQIAVIEDIKDGRNLVVEGPPGTGKSQTITNLIAELLALGKTVLFVSEKMAALEVVKSRLDKVGLGDFCLELHSRKSKKKEVLKELEKSISRQAAKKDIREAEYTQLDKLRSELNGYAKSLREPIGALGQSPFGLYCMKETAFCHFSEAGTSMPQLKLTGVKGYDQNIWDEATSTITNLAEALRLVKPVTRHPWSGGQISY